MFAVIHKVCGVSAKVFAAMVLNAFLGAIGLLVLLGLLLELGQP